MIDGVIRLCCEVGVPSLMLVDQESSILKVLREVDVRNLDMLLHKEKGIRFRTCPENQARYTDRAARSLIKLFHIDDISWQQEMDLIEKVCENAVTSYDIYLFIYLCSQKLHYKYHYEII